VQAVKDQGTCSAGYAFAAIGAAESAWFIQYGAMFNLSEQNMIDCDHYGAACVGGFCDGVYVYAIESQGGFFSTEDAYPFTGQEGTCKFVQGPVSIQAYTYAGGGDERALKDAVYGQGPIACSVNAIPTTFQLYSGGIYEDDSCTFWESSHSVLTVGYGNDADSGKDYWIVKNSWGVKWGIDGYILIRRNDDNMCGIASSGVVPQVN
jgi:cathepsin L